MSRLYPQISISNFCAYFDKTRQAYYKSLKSDTIHAENHGDILEKVTELRKEQPRIGTAKLRHLLNKDTVEIGRDKLYSVLRQNGMLIKQRKKYRPITTNGNGESIYTDHRKLLVIKEINQLWCCDITYISLKDESRFCYATFVTDEKSHLVVGHTISINMSADVVLVALQRAIQQQGKGENCNFERKLHFHTDRGSQFKSAACRLILDKHGIVPSMTAAGKSSENPVAERLNGILKNELLVANEFENFDLAEKAINRVVVIYNEKRPHLSNEMLTPFEAHNNQIGPLKKLWRPRKKRTS